MPRTVALDITESTVYAVVMEGCGRKARVVGCYSVPVSSGGSAERHEVVREAIEELFSENNLRRDNVVVSLSARQCLLRQIWLPFTRPEQISRTLPFEVENRILSCQLSDVVLAYAKICETEQRSEVLVAAAPREMVEESLELLAGCGIDPIAIDLDIVALYNALRRSSLADNDRGIVLADLQVDGLRLVVAEEGDLRLARGCSISPSFKGNGEDAGGYFATVAREIRLALGSKSIRVDEDNFFITGAVAGEQDAAAALGKELGHSVRPYDFVGAIGGNATAGPAYTTALGTGLKGVGASRLKTDFRVGEYVYRTGYQLVKKSLLALVCIGLVAFLIAGAHVRRNLLPHTTEQARDLVNAEESLWRQTVLADGDLKPGSLASALASRGNTGSGKTHAESFSPPLHLLNALKNIDGALTRYVEEQDNPQLYVRNILYVWQEGEGVVVKISGQFGKPAADTNWIRFKQLLNEEGQLRVVEGPDTTQTVRDQGSGFRVKLNYRQPGRADERKGPHDG